GAGDGDALALASGEGQAAVADLCVEGAGHGLNEVHGVGATGGVFDLGAGRAGAGVGDVLGDGAREEDDFLGDDGDLVAEGAEVGGGEIDAVDQDAPAGGQV